VVLGVSPDSPKSHTGFAEKFKLPFELISDEDKKICKSYGVWVYITITSIRDSDLIGTGRSPNSVHMRYRFIPIHTHG